MWFIYLAIGLLIGAVVVYVVQKPKMKTFIELDEKTAQANKELQIEFAGLQIELAGLNSRRDEVMTSIAQLEKQAQEAADLFYQSKMEVAQNKLNQDLADLAKQHEENVQHFSNEYSHIVSDTLDRFKDLSDQVAVMKATTDAAIAAAKRAEEMKDNLAFYRIQLSAADIKEIEMLRSVEPYLRDKEPLNKIIWKCYYEKPSTDLIGRVIGGGIHTGIYKITEIETGKCYVGQAANLADRWKQHIKRGVGADTPTRNKLYPAMNAAGPENFTFEIIEECTRALLDEREDYWQDYFKAKEFGYSIK